MTTRGILGAMMLAGALLVAALPAPVGSCGVSGPAAEPALRLVLPVVPNPSPAALGQEDHLDDRRDQLRQAVGQRRYEADLMQFERTRSDAEADLRFELYKLELVRERDPRKYWEKKADLERGYAENRDRLLRWFQEDHRDRAD